MNQPKPTTSDVAAAEAWYRNTAPVTTRRIHGLSECIACYMDPERAARAKERELLRQLASFADGMGQDTDPLHRLANQARELTEGE